MALRTLGLSSTTAIQTALRFSESMLDADIGAMDQQIDSDLICKQNQAGGYYSPGPAGTILTGTLTSGSPTVTGCVLVVGAPLVSISVVGGPQRQVLGQGVPAPTYVLSFSGTTLTLTQNATANGSAYLLLIAGQNQPNGNFSRNGQLIIPGRGVLQMQRGDVPAVDNTGWPILVSGASIDYQGSIWTLTPSTQA